MGQTVDRAEEALDIARAYLEVSVLENLDQAEELAQESLQVFQEFNRRKLEAAARKLLGEIYLKRDQRNQPNAEAIAQHFLSESLQIYQELDLVVKVTEVEQLYILFPHSQLRQSPQRLEPSAVALTGKTPAKHCSSHGQPALQEG